jgi:hypothetical protein
MNIYLYKFNFEQWKSGGFNETGLPSQDDHVLKNTSSNEELSFYYEAQSKAAG